MYRARQIPTEHVLQVFPVTDLKEHVTNTALTWYEVLFDNDYSKCVFGINPTDRTRCVLAYDDSDLLMVQRVHDIPFCLVRARDTATQKLKDKYSWCLRLANYKHGVPDHFLFYSPSNGEHVLEFNITNT